MLPYLSDAEIANICEPLVAPAAQIRYMKSLGMVVYRKPNGRPLVARSEFDRVLVGRSTDNLLQNNSNSATQPNRAALIELFRGTKNGAHAQRR